MRRFVGRRNGRLIDPGPRRVHQPHLRAMLVRATHSMEWSQTSPLITLKLPARRRPHDRAHPRTEPRFMKLVIALASILVAAAALAAPGAPPQPPTTLKGEVLETQNVDIYTYLRLKTKDGEIWAAVPTTTVKKGAEVTIGNSMVMRNFESKTLKKTFDQIVFGQIVDPNATPATPSPHGAAAPAAPAAAAVPKVAKAMGPDAKTVAEVVKGKATLKDKTVLVRGQVVKVNLGIMGKNWVHLQDGSGSAADGTNDILVTTKDVAALGDVVQAKGTVRTDVNVGPGYAYAVLIEDAAVRK
jgi:DNA/RNA endonuclease YhcR with UshA esterase domain